MEKCVATILGWAAARTALASPAAHRVENVTTTDAGPNSSATHTPSTLVKGLWGVECILAVIGTGGPVK
eukprot:2186466-Pyramimonas_sp.AAC.2